MDPNERLTCEQLLEHPYFDKRFMEGFDLNQTEQQIRRQRDKRDRDRRERERNASRQTVPTKDYNLPQLTTNPHPPMTQSPIPPNPKQKKQLQPKHASDKHASDKHASDKHASDKYGGDTTHLPNI
ncbi:hypothetical protein NP493_236g02001 [Ridgeia piscesae]|uniref:Uncharacterized protein n=1 Tax=Ridgeia piscesae TaxID=27915 RepID=A0AAD9NZN2_RIDPI|nr:hypothetical protein NP493_236g02001 [Ridgeia piscesae]